MTPIKEIIFHLENATHPVARAIHKGAHFKVLAIGFNKGMILSDHQAHLTSKLTLLSGKVIYKENNREIEITQFDEIDIPINTIHSVEAIEDSLCLLTQG